LDEPQHSAEISQSDATEQVELDPGERVVLHLDRCAVIEDFDTPQEPDGGAVPLATSPAVHRWTVPSLGLARRIADHGRQAADDPRRVGWASPARVTLTDRKLVATGVASAAGQTWRWQLDAVHELIQSASEPCTVLRNGARRDYAVLVPPQENARFRDALLGALEAAHQTSGTTETMAAIHVDVERSFEPLARDGEPVTALPTEQAGPPPQRRRLTTIPGFADRTFRGTSWLAGLSVLAIMAMVGLFLLIRALHALQATGLKFLTTSEWQPDSHRFGIKAVLTGTILIAFVALAAAIPLAIGTALFISEVAPRRIKWLFISGVDLMAAVPSVVYGLWGFKYFQGHVIGVSRWIATWFSWIPVFKVTGANPRDPLATPTVFTASTFIAGLVVALMVIPIACSIMREVFSQAPVGEREGALALGATRWGMIRSVVLPFGRGGMIGAIMLGLGRALGETVAVYLIISPVFRINWHILQVGSNSVSSLIVLRQGDASGFGLSALMAAGLALFTLTLIVNFTASAMVARSRSGSLSEA